MEIKPLVVSFILAFAVGVLIAIYPTSNLKEPKSTKVTVYEVIADNEAKLEPEPCVQIIEKTEPELVSLGEYKLTAYCHCTKCCGKSDGITASGTMATEKHTIAVDPKVIPYGSKVLINGTEYVAEDCGGAIKGNHIDIYFNDHSEALKFGVQYADVYFLNEEY